MPNEWHYTLNGQQISAPATSTQLKQLATSGQLKPSDLVWQEGMPDWVPASAVRGLFPAAGKPLGDSSIVPPQEAEKPDEQRKPAEPAAPRDWTNLHPVAVVLLTILTAGLFGLVYIVKICRAYRERAAARRTDASGRTLGRVRHPVAVLLLSYLTLGLYFAYWTYRVLRECEEYTGRKELNPRSELSLMLLFPPYIVFVAGFQLADRIRRAQTTAGVPETPGLRQGIFFLNPLFFFALPYLGMVYQEALNQIWLNVP